MNLSRYIERRTCRPISSVFFFVFSYGGLQRRTGGSLIYAPTGPSQPEVWVKPRCRKMRCNAPVNAHSSKVIARALSPTKLGIGPKCRKAVRLLSSSARAILCDRLREARQIGSSWYSHSLWRKIACWSLRPSSFVTRSPISTPIFASLLQHTRLSSYTFIPLFVFIWLHS